MIALCGPMSTPPFLPLADRRRMPPPPLSQGPCAVGGLDVSQAMAKSCYQGAELSVARHLSGPLYETAAGGRRIPPLNRSPGMSGRWPCFLGLPVDFPADWIAAVIRCSVPVRAGVSQRRRLIRPRRHRAPALRFCGPPVGLHSRRP